VTRSTLAGTQFGSLLGVQKGPVIQWRGVPYAAPPVGPRRFCPPEPPRAWDGVRDASKFAPAAPQPPSPLQSLVGGQPRECSEDCLYLNVFAPLDADGGRPVMVWIHGGAFVGGSGSARWYDGGRFAADGGVVVVTFNYRLGALGFLELGNRAGGRYRSAGNCGILDQIAALRWVRDNVASFGGDPNQVTVFGESAGAMSIGTMLAMPAVRGLFQRAILQSGAASAYRTRDEAERVTEAMLTSFGGTADELITAPVNRIMEAQAAVTSGSDATAYLSFRPVVDGIDIPEPPDVAIEAGDGADVAVLVGTNRDEMTLFTAFDPRMVELSEGQVERRATALIGAQRWARLAGHYRAEHPDGGGAAVLTAVTTDLVFRIPAIRLAEGLAGESRTDEAAANRRVGRARVGRARAGRTRPPPTARSSAEKDQGGSKRCGCTGSTGRAPCWGDGWALQTNNGYLPNTHGLDVPFVWDLMDMPGVESFTGDAPGRHSLAKAVHAAWLAFATRGDPTTPLLPPWPRYCPPGRATMILDDPCRVINDPNGAERQGWSVT
jgi:para-nitrobenzyl esterase